MRLASLAFSALLGAAPSLAACGHRGDVHASRDEVARAREFELDVAAVRRVLEADPTQGALTDVERALDDDRPVRAAELIDVNAEPAARDVAARMRRLGTRGPEGRALVDRAAAALDARAAALAAYARVLSRGPVEDAALLDAMRGYRRSEATLAALLDTVGSADVSPPARSGAGSTGAAP